MNLAFLSRGSPMSRVVYASAFWLLSFATAQAASDGEHVRQDDLRRSGIAWNDVASLPVKCPYQGEGWTISFSDEFYESYKRRGFSLKAMCLSLGSEDVKFDPETGERLECYSLIGWESGGCFPFYVSDCFRSVKVLSGDGTAEQVWRPTGCTVRFDPKTGKAVNGSVVKLFTGGDAGDAPDQSQAGSSVSSARLGKLLSGKQ